MGCRPILAKKVNFIIREYLLIASPKSLIFLGSRRSQRGGGVGEGEVEKKRARRGKIKGKGEREERRAEGGEKRGGESGSDLQIGRKNQCPKLRTLRRESVHLLEIRAPGNLTINSSFH